MSKFLHKGICLMLALVLAQAVLPAVAPKASAEVLEGAAAAGSFDIVLYEEDFNYASLSEFTATGASRAVSQGASNYTLTFENGCVVGTLLKAANTDFTFTFPVNIPAYDTSGMGVNIEVRAKSVGTAGTVRFQFSSNTTGIATNTDFTIPDLVGKAQFNPTVDNFVIYNCNMTANSAQDSISINFRPKATIGCAIAIDYVKVTLVPTGDKTAALNYCLQNGYDITLNEDVTVSDTLSLGNDTVLDLNGHTLTAPALSTMPTSQVVDNGATKGKLVMAKGTLEIANPDNTMLPLYNGVDGYVFVGAPELNAGDHYELTNTSYDGFTLQFRPGFGEVNGNSVRGQYLYNGQSGITMDVELGWKDAFDTTGNSDVVYNADTLLGMYANDSACGQISVTGAQEYKDISVIVSIESCGVRCVLDPMTFTNDKVTYHQLGHAFTPSGANTKLTDRGVFTTGAGKTLVIDFDFHFNGNYDPEFCFAVRDYDTATNNAIFCANGYQKQTDYTLLATCERRINSTNPEVNVRFAIDMETGEYTYQFDDLLKGGTNANLPGLFDGDKDFRFVAPAIDSVDTFGDYTIENLLIYTIDTGVTN